MGTFLVILLSLGIGAATYAATMRAGRRTPAAVGFDGAPRPGAYTPGWTAASATGSAAPPLEEPEAADDPPIGGEVVPLGVASRAPSATSVEPSRTPAFGAPAPDPGYTYLQVSTGRVTWYDRIAGLVGMVVLVVIGSGVLAFAVYELGHAVNAVIQRFLNS
jgi:hypothetical protein